VATNTFGAFTTLLVYAHDSGERVALVTGVDVSIASSRKIQVPATYDENPIVFEIVEGMTKLAGNYESSIALAKAISPGKYEGGVGAITQFVGSPPFTGAVITNVTTITGGNDPESDEGLVSRLARKLNELSRGTPTAIESCLIGLQDPNTNQQITSANLVESFTDNEHVLYVDDGTGFTPTRVNMAQSNVSNVGPLAPGAAAVVLDSATTFPSSGWIFLSPETPAQAELKQYSSKTGNTLTFVGVTALAHDDNDEVLFVEVMTAEEAQNFFRFNYFPIQRNSYRIFHNGSGDYVECTDITDYFLNRTDGEIEFTGSGLPAGSNVLGHFTYYTGLYALAQKTLNGYIYDTVNYPGFASAGTIIYIDTPVIREITISLQTVVSNGYSVPDVTNVVKTTVEAYVGGLLIGENVLLSRIIDLVMSIEGVDDVKVLDPTENIVILENELPKPFDSTGTSLVTVY
jgi:hypothetical protein